jgi:hypothetical protein
MIEVLKQALEALEIAAKGGRVHFHSYAEALRQAIAELESQERNFCPRCGKRTPDLTHIHTCTPPQRTEQEPVKYEHKAYTMPPQPEQKTSADDFFKTIADKNPKPFPPSQREWVGLTDEEIESYWDWEDFQTGAGRLTILEMVRDIEAKLKEKNTSA